MPRRNDISSILVIGAGPITIGQACEFDYSGTQAIKALKEEGYRVVLANSNPATIMTDPEMADATYIEPLIPAVLTRIIERERPAALLATMGGQTALNLALALDNDGVLRRLNVELIGAKIEAIKKAESRSAFRDAMKRIPLPLVEGEEVTDLKTARRVRDRLGYPLILRPSFTLGGSGGGVVENAAGFEAAVLKGLAASPVGGLLIEQSVLGWKEFEMEVVRDRKDNCMIVCSMENIDPMGVHTGDSLTIAPALTLTDKEYQVMRNAAIAVLREIGVETGGSNVQFAVNPDDGRMVVVEMNPRVSRSSALASKATGFPIARVAAKLAVGYTLDELNNEITACTPASFEPTLDYVVVKAPRFAFEKFGGNNRDANANGDGNAEAVLGTSMQSVGEVMAIGRSFREALHKALRALENAEEGLATPQDLTEGDTDAVRRAIRKQRPDRLLCIAEGLRRGLPLEEVRRACGWDPWFLREIATLVKEEEYLKRDGLPDDIAGWRRIKGDGFGDTRLAALCHSTARACRLQRRKLGLRPVYRRIDSCGGEFPAQTPYLYATWQGEHCESQPKDRRKALILGAGPNRIGQGLEFDYCCVHAAKALGEAGVESIMVNCNPETVSTDFDTADRLYCEPVAEEDVLAIAHSESLRGHTLGAIVQFGGQTPLNLSRALENEGVTILGTPLDAIDRAEDRQRCRALLSSLNIAQPRNATATSLKEAASAAEEIGFPVLIRPSYVLGGRAMRIAGNRAALLDTMEEALRAAPGPVLVEACLKDAVEVDVDAVCDGANVFVAGVLEHIEEAGVHSGDSACACPPHSLSPAIVRELERLTRAIALALGVRGFLNIQYAIQGEDIYVLELNPRASRTVPFVAKTTGVAVARIATHVMLGTPLAHFGLDEKNRKRSHVGVKEAVIPFARFPDADTRLGPEMKATGEVMGLDRDFAHAYAKSQMGGGVNFPLEGALLLSVRDADKKEAAARIARKAVKLGFTLTATEGTARWLAGLGLEASRINKLSEGAPHVVDVLLAKGAQLVVNTEDGAATNADGFAMRRAAVAAAIPYYTTLAGAAACMEAIEALKKRPLEVAPLQSYADKAPGRKERSGDGSCLFAEGGHNTYKYKV